MTTGCSSDAVIAATDAGADSAAADAGAALQDGAAVANGIVVSIDGTFVVLDNVKRSNFVVVDASEQGSTVVSADSATTNVSLHLELHGKTPGVYPCAGGERNHVVYTGDGVYIASGSGGTSGKDLLGECSIEVTAYGEVGGIIEGKFSATLPKSAAGASDPSQRVLREGKFRVVRGADL